jgi:molecular chaperone HtpG
MGQISRVTNFFKKNNIEVIYMLDAVDEYFMSGFNEYENTPLKSIDQADLNFLKNIEEKEPAKEKSVAEQSKLDKLIERFKTVLGHKVTEVKESKRLTGSPCCIVNPEGTGTANMQKLMKMVNKDFQLGPKIFEINPEHALIKNLAEICKTGKNPEVLDKCCLQLFDNALILDDLIFDLKEMVPRLNDMMADSTNVLLDKFGRGNIIIAP